MNTRDLTDRERSNLEAVRVAGIPTVILFVTATGIKKSIMDATLPLRTMLADASVHDFAIQQQGPRHKRIVPGKILLNDRVEDLHVSFYRPETKKGDPRLWPANFARHASADDVFVVFVSDSCPCFLNLTRSNVAEVLRLNLITPPVDFLAALRRVNSFIADELLVKLRTLAGQGSLVAVCQGDTSVGRTIETALGIAINSSKEPDYKGIEIKSKRWLQGRGNTRYTLFACVPNWVLSPCKSSAEILTRYGYERGTVRKLYCSVSATKRNSQGLQFRIDSDLGRLVEFAWQTQSRKQDVAVWELGRLHQSFGNKHRETFWIHVDPVKVRDADGFKLVEVVHTRGPSYPQFDKLLEDGVVSMDHLIKKTDTRVSEKGPLFKVDPKHLNELFLSSPRAFRF